MDSATRIINQVEAHERLRTVDREAIRKLSLEERTQLIKSACRAAQAIDRSRIESGLPLSEPTPWPRSTWELLRKYAPNGRAEDSAR